MELFANNLINWVALICLIAWLWMKYVPKSLSGRKDSIEMALQNAQAARVEGEAFLAEQKAKLAQAEKESDKIVTEAKQVAKDMQQEIEAQAQKELADLKTRIEQDIANQRQMAITEMRSQAAKAAILLSRNTLPQAMNPEVEDRLMNQFVDQLDSLN